MKRLRCNTRRLIFTVAMASCTFAQAPQSVVDSASTVYGQLPMVFEPNTGQADPQVRFLTRTQGATVFFTDTEAVMVLHHPSAADRRKTEHAVIRMKLMGATAPNATEGLEKLPGASNYFIGNERSAWRTDIPQYGRVRHSGVYPGVDLVYYGNNKQLEYDFVVAPDANPNQVQLTWEGVDAITLNNDGDLVLRTPLGDVVQKKPRVYQDTAAGRVEVASNYILAPHRRVLFAMAKYDHQRPLVIDPVVVYSTNLVGVGNDAAHGIAVDSCGYAYVTGTTPSANFPATAVNGSNNPSKNAVWSDDVFVTKFSMNGTSTVYSTYFGGFQNDRGFAIAVDSTGAAYVTGATNSNSTSYTAHQFPTTTNAFQTGPGGGWDAFITKLSPAGNALVFSTFLGGAGEDEGLAIAVDSTGAYVTGYTVPATSGSAFPTSNAYQSSPGTPAGQDAFVTKVSPAGAMVYSTFLGGEGDDMGNGIAVDGAGSAYVTGSTTSAKFFPVTASAFRQTYSGLTDAFVTKLSPTGNSLVYSTYIGGSGEDIANAIAVDSAGSAYITGFTYSAPSSTIPFPLQGAFQSALSSGLSSNSDAFVTKLSPAGDALVYSTYFGGSGYEIGYGIAVDSSGAAYVAGYATKEIPTQMSPPAGDNGFVAKFAPAGNALVYAMFLGGSGNDYANAIAVDSTGAAYVAGTTTVPPAVDSDAFITKVIDNPVQPPQGAQITSPVNPGITGGACVIFVWNTVPAALSYELDVTAPGVNYAQNVGLAPSQQVCGLPTNGSAVQVTLKTNFACLTASNSYTYTGALLFVFPGTAGVMQTPVPGSNIPFAAATFTWSAGSKATSYQLDVGTWPGVGNLYSHNVGLQTSSTLIPLPMPSTIYVRLTTFFAGGGQVYFDYSYTVSRPMKGR